MRSRCIGGVSSGLGTESVKVHFKKGSTIFKVIDPFIIDHENIYQNRDNNYNNIIVCFLQQLQVEHAN